jgi:hypothetical protein
MTTLEAVLEAPKKERTVTDPHQKVLKKLARLGWNQFRDNRMLVRQYGDQVYVTNSYAMRRWGQGEDVALAVRSVLTGSSFSVAGESADEMMFKGFEMSLTAGKGGSFLVANGPEMRGVGPEEIPESEVTSWESSEGDRDLVFGSTDDGRRVLVSAKYLKACVDGVDGPRVFMTRETSPLVITERDGVTVHAILMPRRS